MFKTIIDWLTGDSSEDLIEANLQLLRENKALSGKLKQAEVRLEEEKHKAEVSEWQLSVTKDVYEDRLSQAEEEYEHALKSAESHQQTYINRLKVDISDLSLAVKDITASRNKWRRAATKAYEKVVEVSGGRDNR